MPVPPNHAVLRDYVEEYFNKRSKCLLFCDGDCEALTEKTKWVSITDSDEAKFLIVILTRGIETLEGYSLVKNKIKSTENIKIR